MSATRERREALAAVWALWLLLLLCLVPTIVLAATPVAGVRVWPSPEYTRITIETPEPVQYTLFTIKDPDRVVLDLEDVEPAGELGSLPGRIGADDPFVREARVGRYKPGVTRLVLDLKTEANPQAFSLRPVGEYAHRLVVDVYPARPVDLPAVDHRIIHCFEGAVELMGSRLDDVVPLAANQAAILESREAGYGVRAVSGSDARAVIAVIELTPHRPAA